MHSSTATDAIHSVLGFDYSLRKIGVASGQAITKTASPLKTIICANKQINWTEIDHIVQEWRPDALIVGLPLNQEGLEQDSSKSARYFGDTIANRYKLPVFYMDERYSSREASHLLGYDGNTSPRRIFHSGKKAAKKKRMGEDIDSMAATIILQSWLNLC